MMSVPIVPERGEKLIATMMVLATACQGQPPPPPPGPVGAECTVDADCAAGLSCMDEDWTLDGVCTRPCEEDANCPAGSRCALVDILGGETLVMRCAQRCDRVNGARGGCREGFQCAYGGVCTLGCSDRATCVDSTCELASGRCLGDGDPGARTGDACSVATDCRPSGGCAGGRCVHLDCDLGGEYACAEGEVCATQPWPYDLAWGRCFTACEPTVDAVSADDPGPCSRGETCHPPEADPAGMAERGFCALPYEGFAADPDALVGDPCSTVADCPNPFGWGVCLDGYCTIIWCGAAAVAGMDLCGAGADCFRLEIDEMAVSSRDRVFAELGICLRDCREDPSVCGPSTSCQEVGGCF